MKRLVFLLLLVPILFAGCKIENRQQITFHGTLIGYDFATCPICGGIKVVIDDDTTKKPPPFYRINSTLPALGIPENTAFPIKVTLNWKKDTSAPREGNYILVSNVRIQH
jgi:hypothetical protein